MNRNYLAEFLLALPPDLPDPDIGLEDDGDYDVSWYGPDGKSFSVSISERGYCFAYTMEDGGMDLHDDRRHGYMTAEGLPGLLDRIKRVVGRSIIRKD